MKLKTHAHHLSKIVVKNDDWGKKKMQTSVVAECVCACVGSQAQECPSFVEECKVSYFVKFGEEPMLCVLGLRMKRDEIKRLKAQLLDRDKVIQVMRDQEAAYLAQAESFKVSSIRIIKKIM
jgi:hypothetical protein